MRERNFSTDWIVSNHAKRRMAQRNISKSDIEFVMTHGQQHHATGVVFFSLRRKDIPADLGHLSSISRLEGTVVLVGMNEGNETLGMVITVYRNRQSGIRSARRKSKINFNCNRRSPSVN